MTTLEQAARAWRDADRVLQSAMEARDRADRAYAEATVRAFDTIRSAADIERDRMAIEDRGRSANAVRAAKSAEMTARDALLAAARNLS